MTKTGASGPMRRPAISRNMPDLQTEDRGSNLWHIAAPTHERVGTSVMRTTRPGEENGAYPHRTCAFDVVDRVVTDHHRLVGSHLQAAQSFEERFTSGLAARCVFAGVDHAID